MMYEMFEEEVGFLLFKNFCKCSMMFMFVVIVVCDEVFYVYYVIKISVFENDLIVFGIDNFGVIYMEYVVGWESFSRFVS